MPRQKTFIHSKLDCLVSTKEIVLNDKSIYTKNSAKDISKSKCYISVKILDNRDTFPKVGVITQSLF